jgi:hypothetical protein
MSWLRWWDGTCSDPKWRVVAARSKQPVGNVVAVWAWLLEKARANDGELGDVDAEEIAITFGYDIDGVNAVLAAMTDKVLIENGAIRNWRKRQPKREDDSRERVTEWRKKKAEERNAPVRHGNAPEAEAEADTEKKEGNCPKPAKKRVRANVKYDDDFERFWKAYPNDGMPKGPAYAQWNKLSEAERKRAIASVPGFLAYCSKNDWYRPVWAERYLKNGYFDTHAPADATEDGTMPVPLDSQLYRPLLSRFRQEKGCEPEVNGTAAYFPTPWVMAAIENTRPAQ